MPDFEDWDAPELSSADERAYLLDVVKTGIRFLVFTCLLYTVGIWGFSNLLVRSDILSGSISWQHAGIMSFGIVVLRLWNKSLFK
jgi:hypothetical protein